MFTVELSAAEMEILCHGLRREALFLRKDGENQPLTSQDPNTKRYELFERAASFNRRANELALATYKKGDF